MGVSIAMGVYPQCMVYSGKYHLRWMIFLGVPRHDETETTIFTPLTTAFGASLTGIEVNGNDLRGSVAVG